MVLLFVTVAIAIVAGVALLIVADRPLLADDPVDARSLVWPPEGPLGPEALASARFTVAVRGYRMDEVDLVLADATRALAERDVRIADLEARVDGTEPRSPAVMGDNATSSPPGVPE